MAKHWAIRIYRRGKKIPTTYFRTADDESEAIALGKLIAEDRFWKIDKVEAVVSPR